MNIKQIIQADHHLTRKVFQKDGGPFLNISEFYYDTIQGEGIYIGQPAAFLRLKGCTLNCMYCDTTEVWKYGTPYSFSELCELMSSTMLISKLKEGQHLVITGGSPLLQQESLVRFIEAIIAYFGIKPFIEIENECMFQPLPELIAYVNCWNNSPKLFNSGILFKHRFNALAIGTVAVLDNSWFKFVVDSEEDWIEIESNFLDPGFITRDQIILMPEGCTREEIEDKREMVIDMAIRHGVRYSTREHIICWNKKVGV